MSAQRVRTACIVLFAVAPACKKSPPPPTPRAPIAIAPAGAAYVTNNGSDSVSVFARDGANVVTVPLDLDPDEHEAPHHLALDSRAGSLFVALAYPAPPTSRKDPHAAHGNAESRGKLVRLALTTLAVEETRELDHNPGEVILTHDRGRVLVTHFDMKRAMNVAAAGGTTGTMFARLQVWDARALRQLASRPLCVAPHGAITTADDRLAVVACYGSDEVAVVDLTSPHLATARYPLGAAQGVPGAPTYGPYSVTLAPDGARVVVATLEAQDIRIFDLATRRFADDKTIYLHARAFFPAFVGPTTVVVPTQAPDGLVRVDVAAGRIEARVALATEVCKAPHAARRANDGRVYVVCEGDHVAPGSVIAIDPMTLAVQKRWQVGVYPDGIAFGDE